MHLKSKQTVLARYKCRNEKVSCSGTPKSQCCLNLSYDALIIVITVQQFCLTTEFKIMKEMFSFDVSRSQNVFEKYVDSIS